MRCCPNSFRSILKYSVFGNPHKTARQEPTYSWFWRACFCYMKSFSASKSACAMLPLVHHIFCKLALFTQTSLNSVLLSSKSICLFSFSFFYFLSFLSQIQHKKQKKSSISPAVNLMISHWNRFYAEKSIMTPAAHNACSKIFGVFHLYTNNSTTNT